MTAQQNSALITPAALIIQVVQANPDQIGKLVLSSLTQPPQMPDEAIDALQQLMQLLTELGSTHPESPEVALTMEDLVPYCVEEALNVLDLLSGEHYSRNQEGLTSPLFQLESLACPILWAIAGRAYPLMELLEGTGASARSPGQTWTAGVLRLVPLLEVSTPQQYWRFDLTTGHPPEALIDQALQINFEREWVPALLLNLPADHSSPAHGPVVSATQHLQRLKSLCAGHSTLHTWLQGMAVKVLSPGNSWLEGEVKLNLDFEFTVQQKANVAPAFPRFPGNWVEAELLEGAESVVGNHFSSICMAAPVAVVDLPAALLEPTTLIRIADPLVLASLTDYAQHQIMQAAIAQLQQTLQSPTAVDPVLAAIHLAHRLNGLVEEDVPSYRQQNFSLLQPELLMDEVVPKLVWQISQISYPVMQWIGGLPVTLLQPDRPWETGTLRLMAVLQLSCGDRTWQIDLAPGRFIPAQSWQLNPDAVVMGGEGLPGTVGHPGGQVGPMRVSHLLEQLLSPIPTTAPAIACLQTAIAVEWLTSDQEWHPGQLLLDWGFDWMPESP
jgi:hypothetical protein